MIQYKNKNSGVVSYQIGDDFIDVKFQEGTVYRYTYESAGKNHIEKMKLLAIKGKGLSTYISTTIKSHYAIKCNSGV